MLANKERFEVVSGERAFPLEVFAVVDTETGVQYLYVTRFGGTGGGLTPLIKDDGKPMQLSSE